MSLPFSVIHLLSTIIYLIMMDINDSVVSISYWHPKLISSYIPPIKTYAVQTS